MSETMTETPTTPTEGKTSSEAVETSLLTGSEGDGSTQQQQDATQTDKPAAETVKTEEAKPEGAPESYDFKAPEGKTYDVAITEPFAAAAKEANLTQDVAQKLLNTMAPVIAERQQAQIEAVRAGWKTASETDKEFGGEKLQANLAIAKKAMDAYGSPELNALLKTTGLGNNPEVIRLMYRAGLNMSEDGFVNGKPAGGQRRDLGAILYDNTPQGAK